MSSLARRLSRKPEERHGRQGGAKLRRRFRQPPLPACLLPGGALSDLYEEIREKIRTELEGGAELVWICAGKDLEEVERHLRWEFLGRGIPNAREWGPWEDQVGVRLRSPEVDQIHNWYWLGGVSPAVLETYQTLRKDRVEPARALELTSALLEESPETGGTRA